jgi:hypothetical protein
MATLRRLPPKLRSPRCCFADTARGALGKIVSNAVCYPIDTCKTVLQSRRELRIESIRHLYAGFPVFCAYNAVHSLVYYGLFFYVMNALPDWSYASKLKVSTVTTSVLTGLYRVPVTFYLRNAAVLRRIDWRDVFKNARAFRTKYAVVVLEDIPDTYLKFYCRHLFDRFFDPFRACLLAALVVAVVMTPLDAWKTFVMTSGEDPKRFTFRGWQFRVLSVVLNAFIFLTISRG